MPLPSDPYARLRPPSLTPTDEICSCAGAPPLVLVSRLSPNPLACFECNGEVAPERIPADAALIDSVAAWRNVYDALYRLWLDSREYEAFACTQLASPASPVNQTGIALASRLAVSQPVYYWWFSEGPAGSTCPRCGVALANLGRHVVCSRCSIIVEPVEIAG